VMVATGPSAITTVALRAFEGGWFSAIVEFLVSVSCVALC
jgi:hypothetical protein